LQLFAPVGSKQSLCKCGLDGRQVVAVDDRRTVFEFDLDYLFDDNGVGAELRLAAHRRVLVACRALPGDDDERIGMQFLSRIELPEIASIVYESALARTSWWS
jgi:hypothetical protein